GARRTAPIARSGTCGVGRVGGAAARKTIRRRDDRPGWYSLRRETVPGRDDRSGTVFVAENFGFRVLLRGEPEDAERGQGEHGGRGLAVPRLGDGLDHAQVAYAAAAVVGRVGVDQFAPAARVGRARARRHARGTP